MGKESHGAVGNACFQKPSLLDSSWELRLQVYNNTTGKSVAQVYTKCKVALDNLPAK